MNFPKAENIRKPITLHAVVKSSTRAIDQSSSAGEPDNGNAGKVQRGGELLPEGIFRRRIEKR